MKNIQSASRPSSTLSHTHTGNYVSVADLGFFSPDFSEIKVKFEGRVSVRCVNAIEQFAADRQMDCIDPKLGNYTKQTGCSS